MQALSAGAECRRLEQMLGAGAIQAPFHAPCLLLVLMESMPLVLPLHAYTAFEALDCLQHA